jgi:hypothetical protein
MRFDARLKALEGHRDAGRPLFVSSAEASDIRAKLFAKLGMPIPTTMPPCRGFRLGTPAEEAARTLRVREKLLALLDGRGA